MQIVGKGGDGLCVQYRMCGVGKRESWAQQAFYAGKVLGCEVSGFITEAVLWQLRLADKMCEVARIDTHRAGHGAQAVAGTRLVARIAVLLLQDFQSIGVFSRLFQAGDFPLHYDTLARREGETAGKAVHFAEAAFDAFVGLSIFTPPPYGGGGWGERLVFFHPSSLPLPLDHTSPRTG